MKKKLILRTLLATAAVVFSPLNHATEVIKLTLSAAPGGPQDRVTRLLLPAFSKAIGKTAIVEYKGGAGGTLASGFVAKAPPDGETLLVTTFSYVLTAGSMSNLSYDPRKDLEPVHLFGEAQTVLVTRPNLGVGNLKELAVKAADGKLNYGSNGIAGNMHVAVELFARSSKVQMTNVPYRGAAPALTDLLAGTVDVIAADVTLLQPYVKEGRVKALAVYDTKRSTILPNIPTSVEEGMPDLQMSSWIGVMAPKGTPAAVKKKLSKAFAEALTNPEVVKQLSELGFINPRDEAGFKATLDKDFDFWIPWLKNAGIRAE